MDTPLLVTVIGPEDAPEGTDVVMLEELDDVTTAGVPLKDTMGEGLKSLPLIVTVAPTAPSEGVIREIAGVGNTSKDDALVVITPFNVKEIVPSDAPTGTEVVILLEVEAVTIAATPLKATALLDGVVLKLFPDNTTVAPTAPLVGANPVMDGVGNTVKSSTLVTVTPLAVMEIFPDVAPIGTVVVMLLVVEAMITAVVLLNFTT